MNEKLTNNSNPMSKQEFLRTLQGSMITSEQLNTAYNNYLLKFYGYSN